MRKTATGAAAGAFLTSLFDSTTGFSDAWLAGAPDDPARGLIGQIVTYDFVVDRVANLACVDFRNVARFERFDLAPPASPGYLAAIG